MTPSQAIRAINEALGWPRTGATVMISGPALDDIAGVVSHQDRERRVAIHERDEALKAARRNRRDFRVACIVLAFNTVLMIALAVKYLRIVDLPKPRCLHPVSFTASHLELAPVTEAPRETI